LKKNIRLGELRNEHSDIWYLLCFKMSLQLLFGIEEVGRKREDDSI